MEYIIHESLECCWGIAQPERHNQELVEAVVGAKHHLVDVLRPHAHLMVLEAQVKLGEELGVMELVDDRTRECVLHYEGIQRTVVDVESP